MEDIKTIYGTITYLTKKKTWVFEKLRFSNYTIKDLEECIQLLNKANNNFKGGKVL